MEPEVDEPAPLQPWLDLAALLGLAGIVAGTVLLAGTDLGSNPIDALGAIAAWLPETLPAALLVAAATALDVGVGVVIGRWARGRPFERLDEAILTGVVVAVAKDVLLLGALAGFGAFSVAMLLPIHLAIGAAGVLRLRPILAAGAVPGIPALTPFGSLLLAAWAPPLLLMLASPVVPFIDVLPNHVAPVEHLRTFGTLTSLTDTQSPIYGPSRSFLGYAAHLGTVAGLAVPLPAGAVLSGFILPSTVLVAIGVHRLARAIGGTDVARWTLLTFALTTSLARLSDARATVVVLPIAAWALAMVAERLAAAGGGARETERPVTERRLEAALLGVGLGMAILMHPVIGALAWLTVAVATLARPRLAELSVPALGAAAVIAVPQGVTMLGIALPPVALVLALAGGVGVAIALPGSGRAVSAAVTGGRWAVVGLAFASILAAGPLIRAVVGGAQPLLSVLEVSVVAGAVAIGLRAAAARSVVLWASLAAGFGMATATQLVPAETGVLAADALRFELPKTLHYWVPVFVAILAAAGLRAIVEAQRPSVAARGLAVIAFVLAAALPLRSQPIDAFHLGEHRLSETASIALRWADRGFWHGFPDPRRVVDGPRQELLAGVRELIAAGEIGPDTPVLHVAASFQQWVATPLGVFAGVTETVVAPDALVSIHTVGGRLHPLDDLGRLLASGDYAILLLEPSADALPRDLRDHILAAGYLPVFANAQGELFRLAG